jgi:tRNA(Ile)-lysidine synthase
MKATHMVNQFIQFIRRHSLKHFSAPVAVAVSGGIDSVVLCELCHQASLSFIIVHCNFQLRGEESERDEQFVRSLGKKYGVEVLVNKFDTLKYSEDHKLSIQEAARNLRYTWFNELTQKDNVSVNQRSSNQRSAITLLAHHANDNIETVLMNFFRGTGLSGLTGMPEYQSFGNCLRPLLHNTREEIESFAKENSLQWMEDSSNQSTKYTRNFFRHEIIPALQKVFPQVEQNLLDNISRFEKINKLYQQAVTAWKNKYCISIKNELKIPVIKLLEQKDTSIIYEIIKDYGFGEKQIDEVLKLMTAASGKFIENSQYQMIKHRNWLIIAPKTNVEDIIAIEQESNTANYPGGSFHIKKLSVDKLQLSDKDQIAHVDARHIEYPLLLRKWKQGDYFYPLGMRKKKKLSRFFIDNKLAKNQKDNIWVLESASRIVWVTGMRIDDRFKVTPKTKEVLQFTISSDGHAYNS